MPALICDDHDVAVREGVEAWHATAVTSQILVPSSTKGGQSICLSGPR